MKMARSGARNAASSLNTPAREMQAMAHSYMIQGARRGQRRLQRNKTADESQRTTKTRAVGYVRSSTGEQGHGLEAQETAVRAFAQSQGYDLVALCSDTGISGAVRPAERPGFGRAFELAADGAFSVLLVY